MRHLKVYAKLQLAQPRSAMEYRGDFWIGILGALLLQSSQIVVLITFFHQVDTLGGWTMAEVMILQGLVTICLGLGEMFTDGTWALRGSVNDGTFDRILVRPMPPVLQQMAQLASIHGVGNVGLGGALLGLGLAHAPVQWRWWTPLVLLLTLLCGFVLNAALNLLVNTIAFWEPSAQSAFPTLISTLRYFASFPLDIYGRSIRLVMTWLVPFAVITYLPTSVILGLKSWPWALTPIAAATLTALVASAVWRVGVNRYQGVGH
ncbi:ABC transporter permease [Aestuariimicrobium sp. T2.26MG-19.2B]|uniref:ABC transporter permease n=1 Tax=Aestuariimicrobium sp. T2.26MG-19.2B TaxID=3040679 RepID=UPI002477B5B8|nr:ABC-2 family transporter protein [Aestuariimicrobium sp. T2.26MG-19.2B]CAI9409210.1 hypothetical protein AESSP_02190 [Aestuariimicrobium sp. T2.26MG-19.2B]